MDKLKFTGTVVLITFTAGLALSGCSDEKHEQTKKVAESDSAAVAEQIEKASEKQKSEMEGNTSTVVEAAKDRAQKTTPRVMEDKSHNEADLANRNKAEKSDKQSKTPAAKPETHVIKAAVTRFVPMVIFIKPGDTVTWENMAGHDTTSLPGMIPEGAEPWHSKLGKPFSITLEKEGAYIYKCTPHASLGMMGAIIVGNGEPENLDQIVNNPKNKGMVGRTVRKMLKALEKRKQ